MRTPQKAIADIVGRIEPLAETEAVPLEVSVGRVLAEDTVADTDLPPFEKSAMDGFAVQSADFASEVTAETGTELRVVGEARAGGPFEAPIRPGECVEIYTGASVPVTCDSVVIVEKSELRGDRVRLFDRPAAGQHVAHRGEDLRAGDLVLERGRRLSTVDLAVLASVGRQPVPVVRRPRVASGTTGDELVRPDQTPGPGQIREGNTRTLGARLALLGCDVDALGIVPDDPERMAQAFGAALETCDMLITTGGVSMGKYDLVGDVLESLGVQLVFHKVAIKPGKPIWFGMRGRVPVFGLPGNPVSALVGLEVFVRPALDALVGVRGAPPARPFGRWGAEETRPIAREQYIPVHCRPADDGTSTLTPVAWRGSADVVGLSHADGWAVVAAQAIARPGELVRYHALDPR